MSAPAQRLAGALPGVGGPVGRDRVAGAVAEVDVADGRQAQRADDHGDRLRGGAALGPGADLDRPGLGEHAPADVEVAAAVRRGGGDRVPGAAARARLEDDVGVRGGVGAGQGQPAAGGDHARGGLGPHAAADPGEAARGGADREADQHADGGGDAEHGDPLAREVGKRGEGGGQRDRRRGGLGRRRGVRGGGALEAGRGGGRVVEQGVVERLGVEQLGLERPGVERLVDAGPRWLERLGGGARPPAGVDGRSALGGGASGSGAGRSGRGATSGGRARGAAASADRRRTLIWCGRGSGTTWPSLRARRRARDSSRRRSRSAAVRCACAPGLRRRAAGVWGRRTASLSLVSCSVAMGRGRVQELARAWLSFFRRRAPPSSEPCRRFYS